MNWYKISQIKNFNNSANNSIVNTTSTSNNIINTTNNSMMSRSKAKRKLKEEEITNLFDNVMNLYNQNKSINFISQELGLTRKYVKEIIESLSSSNQYGTGLVDNEKQNRFISRPKSTITQDELLKAAEMYRQGFSFYQIGTFLHRSEQYVMQKLMSSNILNEQEKNDYRIYLLSKSKYSKERLLKTLQILQYKKNNPSISYYQMSKTLSIPYNDVYRTIDLFYSNNEEELLKIVSYIRSLL